MSPIKKGEGLGTARLAVLALLKQGSLNLYEIQKRLQKKKVSGDAVRSNIHHLRRCGIVRADRKQREGDRFRYNFYKLTDGYFCMNAGLVITDPLCIFPCPYFDKCQETDDCRLIDRVALLLGIKVDTVQRIEHIPIGATGDGRVSL